MATKKLQILDSLNKNAVLYTPQELTEEEKVQARDNLNVPSLDENGKIPAELLPDDIGGGLTEVSWEDIKNKPFGKTGWEYTWDGNIEGREVISVAGGYINFYKISSDFIEKSEIIGANYEMYFDSENNTGIIEESSISDGTNGSYVALFNGSTPVIFVAASVGIETVLGMEVEIPSVGVWFPCFDEDEYPSYVGKVSEIKKIDKEYLPDDIGTSVDLSDYYTKNETDLFLSEKADLVDGKIPVSQIPDGIGGTGGVTSWNDLEDKPFGETGLKYEWDGETSDKEHLAIIDGLDFYRISSDIFTADELIGVTTKIYFDGDFIEDEISQDGDIIPVQTASGNLVVVYNGELPMCLIASQVGEDNFMGITFSIPSTGVWFLHGAGEEEYTHYLQKGVGIKTLDRKFIPADIGTWAGMTDKPFGEMGLKYEWDGDTSNVPACPVNGSGLTFYKVSDKVISQSDIVDASIDVFSNTYNITSDMIFPYESGSFAVIVYGNTPVLFGVVQPETLELFGLQGAFAESGLWFAKGDDDSFWLESFEKDYSIEQIDKKYIPDDIIASVSLTFDEFPTEGSQNPVKSMGIHSAISALEGKITSTFCYKGTVENYSDLPVDGNTIGDVWNIASADETHGVEAGDNAAWSGNSWDILAGIMDLSEYYTKAEVDSIALNGTVNLANYYTKSETSDLINNVSVDLSDYYTKSETNNLMSNIDLSNYYTKSEMDYMIGDCDSIINSINTLIGGEGI